MEEAQIERIIALMDCDGKFDDAQGTDATVALWNRLNRIHALAYAWHNAIIPMILCLMWNKLKKN